MAEEKPGTSRSAPTPSILRFGPYELDLRSAELRKNDLSIRLQDQPFQILVALLERPGELVLREEIRNKLWPDDTVVEFDHSINAAVKRLRDALRESAEKPRYIETLARRGYRFIGEVQAGPSVQPESRADQPIAATGLLNADGHVASETIPDERLLDKAPAYVAAWIPYPRIVIPVALAALLFTALAGTWYYRRTEAIRWARDIALPQGSRLVNAGSYTAAFEFLWRAKQVIPGDPALNGILREISHPLSVHTFPAGASVYVKAYDDPNGAWLPIGQSPIENFLLPFGYYRWRVTKTGFRTVEGGAGFQRPTVEFTLDREGSVPPEMVHVPRGDFQLLGLDPVHLDDYWIDKYEVSNRQFKAFIDKGGYRNRQYWLETFVKDGRVLSWEQAMAQFRDATGRPGPSTWEVGDYPPGHDDFPVDGVSWYEALAYAEFAHKQIPTVYHWFAAADQGIWSDILHFSNFDGSGPVRGGSRPSLGPFGTYDMAWNEQRYVYANANAVRPFDRSSANGFRCAKYPVRTLSTALTQPLERPVRDYSTEHPVSDGIFRVLRSFYSYDRAELKPIRESVDDSSVPWKAERITFDAVYDHQRVTARLYVPRNVRPPYETIIYFPPRNALYQGTIDDAEIKRFDFLMRSGRAVLFPVYQGMYERRPTEAPAPGPSGERDRVVQQCKDLRRSVDYLYTRPDISRERLGYFGVSDGARLGLIFLANETRIRAATLSEGGFSPDKKPPEIDEINFAPRVRIPVLMLNGRYDFLGPVETAQAPMFRLLGVPEKDKRHVLFDTGHVVLRYQVIKETLDWFDKYLGPTSN